MALSAVYRSLYFPVRVPNVPMTSPAQLHFHIIKRGRILWERLCFSFMAVSAGLFFILVFQVMTNDTSTVHVNLMATMMEGDRTQFCFKDKQLGLFGTQGQGRQKDSKEYQT